MGIRRWFGAFGGLYVYRELYRENKKDFALIFQKSANYMVLKRIVARLQKLGADRTVPKNGPYFDA